MTAPIGRGFDYNPTTASFADEGRLVVLVQADGQAVAWPATTDGWEQQACAVAGRNFTRAEWNLYVPDRPYEKTCSGEP